MSAWWLLLIVPVSASFGSAIYGLFAVRSYDRGHLDGHQRGYAAGFKAGSSWTVKTERRL